MNSAFYAGEVVHQRFRPRRHRLRYDVFFGLFDLDELPDLDRVRGFGWNRRALLSFHDDDHGDGSAAPLKSQIEAKLWAEGLETGGAVRVLCMPRVFGFVFNPLSVFFCHDHAGRLVATVHQVNNTFGERHFYVLPAEQNADGRVEQGCAKDFRVSPFLSLDLAYRFAITPPGETTSVSILASAPDGPMLTASFQGARRPFTFRSLFSLWLSHPAMTAGVVAAIHWEALFIWLKLKRAAPKRTSAPQPRLSAEGRRARP